VTRVTTSSRPQSIQLAAVASNAPEPHSSDSDAGSATMEKLDRSALDKSEVYIKSLFLKRSFSFYFFFALCKHHHRTEPYASLMCTAF
jgi:hypothetical protein